MTAVAFLVARAARRIEGGFPFPMRAAFPALSILLLLGGAVPSSRAPEPQAVFRNAQQPERRPNVLLISLDTVSAMHMGIYGYPRENTPHLRALLEESTFYSRCMAAAPFTLSSHASIFTGLYPQSHGADVAPGFGEGRPLSKGIPTLASVLRSSGYTTLSIAANSGFLSPQHGLLRGFDISYWPVPAALLTTPSMDLFLRSAARQALRVDGLPRHLDSRNVGAEWVNRRAYALLNGIRPGTQPFFLFLNYMDAHDPYVPPAPYDRKYAGKDAGFTSAKFNDVLDKLMIGHRPLGPGVREHLVSQYDGSIAYEDEKLGELISYLKDKGVYANTMIVITGDHGEAFGEKWIMKHDTSIYQNEIHVPLIVKYPGQTKADRVDALASHVDLMPTILEIVRVQPPAGIEGVSLLHLVEDANRDVVAEFAGNYSTRSNIPCCKYALYSGTRKFIYSLHGSPELYDLAADPGEDHNLYRPDAPESAALRARLSLWSRRTAPRFLQSDQVDAETVERLKSLGYAGQK
jgi:arylsulfatase A-like enzyme